MQIVKGVAAEPELPAPSTDYEYIQPEAFEILWNQKSHWKRPWRGFLETVPAIKLLRGLGINFNQGAAQSENAGRLLANCGFRRARIELGWNNWTYDDPTVLTANAKTPLEKKIAACQKYGLRPLVLLNANSGAPCPNKSYAVTLTAPAKVGDTQIHIEPSQVAGIALGRTGLRGGSIMAYYLFAGKSEDGTITLSQPLKVDIPAGANTTCSIMQFGPWPAAIEDDLKTPKPAFEPYMLGWLEYAGRTCRAVRDLYGSDDFDVEVWNEVSFGTQWLARNNYYLPKPDLGARQQQAIYVRTVAYLRDAANGVPNVKIGNGFLNQNNANVIAPAGAALDRHPYPPIVAFPKRDEEFELTIINLDGQGKEVGGISKVSFIPTYEAKLPEYFLEQIQVESRIYDIAPYGSFLNNSHTGIGGGMGRAPLKSSAYLPLSTDGGLTAAGYLEAQADQGPPREVWFTEIGMFVPASAPGFNAADWRHIQAKIITRQLLAYMNKGVDAIHFYCMFGTGQYQMAEGAFFAATEYPGDEAAGETMMAIKRITSAMAGAEDIVKPRALTLAGLSGGEESISGGFAGDPSQLAKYPDLVNKELFAFFPFQVNDHGRFVFAAYVMSRDCYANHGGTGIGRFDLPAEDYTLQLAGFNGVAATITAEDPLKGTAVTVAVSNRTAGGARVKAAMTDYPFIFTIQEA